MRSAFVDPRLDLAVRAAMPQDVLAQPLSVLTRLDAPGLGVRRLDGIEQLSELRWLDLSRNPIADATPLAGNAKLIRVTLAHTELSTLDGLGGLPDLEDLDVYGSRVLSVAAIAGSPALRSLDLGLCHVRELEPLATLARLESLTLGNPLLHISRRSVKLIPQPVALDLGPLTQLSSLRQLRLYGLKLESVSLFAELVGLEELVLERCEIADELTELPRLPRLELLDLRSCAVPNLAPVAALPRLRVLHLDEAKLADLSPLGGCVSLEVLTLRDTSLGAVRSIERVRALPRLRVLRYGDGLV
jgi:Leucine-rich repeat (LRR) protein